MDRSIGIICIFVITIIQKIDCKSYECNNVKNCHIDEDKLLFAHTLCRHGDRNIYIIIPNDPWKYEKYWPGGYGQLTKVGKQQHYQLGKFFRKRYASLIGNGDYSPNKVYVQSSNVDRVLQSSEVNLAGLFPPKGFQIWNEKLKWQPVPVHTQPQTDDYLLAGDKRCNHFDYVMLQYMNGTEYKGFFERYSSLISYLEKYSGMKLPTITDLANLYDVLFIEQLKHKRLPLWAEQVMQPDGDFQYLAFYWYRMFTATPEMKKLRSGYLLKEILDRFTNKTQMQLSPNRSLWMYFGHDITISNMLNSLGVFNFLQPPYTSCLLFELYQGRNYPYVRIFYKNNTDMNITLQSLNIPKCGVKCPLTRLYSLYEDILPTKSFEDACTLQEGETLPPGGNPENNAL